MKNTRNMWIGKAQRLARVGEYVLVTIDGKVVNAKVARPFSSTKVLVAQVGSDYYAYPEQVQTQRTIYHKEVFKNERKKKPPKYHVDYVYIYFVSSDFNDEERLGSVYLFDGQNSRLLFHTSANNIIPSFVSENAKASVTNFGYRKYRASVRTLDQGKYTLFIASSENDEIETYQAIPIQNSPGNYTASSPEPYLDDWQDPYYRRWWLTDDQIDACIGGRFTDSDGPNRPRNSYNASNSFGLYGFPNLQVNTNTITYLSFFDRLEGTISSESINYPFIGQEYRELFLTIGSYGPPFSYPQSNYNFGDICPVIIVKDLISFELEPLNVGFEYEYLLLLGMSIFYDGPL